MSAVWVQQYQSGGTVPVCFKLRFTISARVVQKGVKSGTSKGARRLRGHTARVVMSLTPTRKERLPTVTHAFINYLGVGILAVN